MSVYRDDLRIHDSQTARRIHAQRQCQATSRRLLATLIWCGLLQGWSNTAQAASASPPLVGAPRSVSDSNPATIVINIDDRARMPSHTRRVAKAETVRIFAAAGVRAIWVDGLTDDQGDTLRHVAVVILAAGTERRISQQAVHPSVVGLAAKGGHRAYVFYARLAEMARLRDRPVGSVIGIAIAHEVGHLLLGGHAHSRSGIMRADLNLRELIPQEFSRGQGDAIRAKLLIRPRESSIATAPTRAPRGQNESQDDR